MLLAYSHRVCIKQWKSYPGEAGDPDPLVCLKCGECGPEIATLGDGAVRPSRGKARCDFSEPEKGFTSYTHPVAYFLDRKAQLPQPERV